MAVVDVDDGTPLESLLTALKGYALLAPIEY
jgi:hypothetical protein